MQNHYLDLLLFPLSFVKMVMMTSLIQHGQNFIAAYKFREIGPIYYEYGSLIITYDNADIAVKAFYMLRDSCYEDKNLLVLVLPNISAANLSIGVRVSNCLLFVITATTSQSNCNLSLSLFHCSLFWYL